jgi:hypothetical protein
MTFTTDEELRASVHNQLMSRGDRAVSIWHSVRTDGLDPAIALRQMEQVITGEADRIVRVGEPAHPLIQTGRD